ncbi:hypothetical protein CBR_g57729 [Chara braunii]|uniref:Transmembrane protein n=1 Tax=Chara braunii TaxID=69332 RepID=A0A388MEC6_CHABU|nr:hypothetical protein CBR_g57729 [Chara braunii]|eukprot:GBG92910.1 hypothetical protein CBR_g57729 [Chara braunii]
MIVPSVLGESSLESDVKTFPRVVLGASSGHSHLAALPKAPREVPRSGSFRENRDGGGSLRRRHSFVVWYNGGPVEVWADITGRQRSTSVGTAATVTKSGGRGPWRARGDPAARACRRETDRPPTGSRFKIRRAVRPSPTAEARNVNRRWASSAITWRLLFVVVRLAVTLRLSYMADVFCKLPLLLLVVILLVVVVFVHVCILGRLPSRSRRKVGARKSVAMDGRRPTQRTLSDPYPTDRAPICAGADRRAAGPSPYEGLPPHLQPLPDSDEGEAEVDVSTTVPLGSGSTQEWTGSQLYDRRGTKYGQSFTSLLHDGAEEEDCLPPVDLTFGLRSGSPSSITRTVLVNPLPDDDAGQVTFGGRGTRGVAATEVTPGKTTAWPRTQATSGPSVPRTVGQRPEWMTLSPPLSGGRDGVCRPVDRAVTHEDFPSEGAHGDGRRVWKDARQELRRQQEESITKGVERLRVGERSGQADVAAGGGDAWANADEVQCDVGDDDSGGSPFSAPMAVRETLVCRRNSWQTMHPWQFG